MIVSERSSNDYYIQNCPVTQLRGGKWSSAACFGSQDRFHILAVVAEPATQTIFRQIRDIVPLQKTALRSGGFGTSGIVALELAGSERRRQKVLYRMGAQTAGRVR